MYIRTLDSHTYINIYRESYVGTDGMVYSNNFPKFFTSLVGNVGLLTQKSRIKRKYILKYCS